MNIPRGYDILSMILKIANPSFDFSAILGKVQDLVLRQLFRLGNTKKPYFNQTALYLAALKSVCSEKFQEFYQQLTTFITTSQRIFSSLDEVNECYKRVFLTVHNQAEPLFGAMRRHSEPLSAHALLTTERSTSSGLLEEAQISQVSHQIQTVLPEARRAWEILSSNEEAEPPTTAETAESKMRCKVNIKPLKR